MATPALVVDDQVVLAGRVPTGQALTALFTTLLADKADGPNAVFSELRTLVEVAERTPSTWTRPFGQIGLDEWFDR